MEMTEPKRIGQLIKSLVSDSKCGKCGIRFRHKDKKWCSRCIDIFRRSTEQKTQIRKALELIGESYFDAYIEDIEHPCQELLLSSGDRDVFLWGDVGAGKTYAMAALLKAYLIEGYDCERINFDEFCSRVRSTMNNNSKQTEYELVGQMTQVDKLFIDDVGLRSKQESDFAYVTFYSILNKRQERMLQTLVTTNKDIDQLAVSFDMRIASRLRSAVNIHMDGPDKRLIQAIFGDKRLKEKILAGNRPATGRKHTEKKR